MSRKVEEEEVKKKKRRKKRKQGRKDQEGDPVSKEATERNE